MTAARHAYEVQADSVDYRRNSLKKQPHSVSNTNVNRSRRLVVESPKPNSSSTIKISPRPGLPKGLKRLQKLETATKVTSLVLVAVSAGFYALTYSAPQTWDQAQQELEKLQKQERQLTQLNESLKYDQAKQARSNPDLVTLDPQRSIFIQAAPAQSTEVKPRPKTRPLKQPLGY